MATIAAMIRRWRQHDALDAALKAYEDMRLERNQWFDGCQAAQKRADVNAVRCSELEAEILRLRKNTLTQTPERVDNSVVKAKSTADVRRLTEAAFGRELLEQREEVHGE
jgi:hypothetical protein